MTSEATRLYAERYPGNDNYQKPWTDYIAKIEGLTDDELFAKLEQAIWLSSYAASNRRSDYHTHLDILCDELRHRYEDEWIEVYDKAYKQAFED
jgi:hypothetical protein